MWHKSFFRVMYMIKMIVTDLDDTLLNDKQKISSYSRSIIKRVQKKGILFVIATARSFPAAAVSVKSINPDWCIYNNGALTIAKTFKKVAVPITATIANKFLHELTKDINVKTIKVSTAKNEYASKPGIIKNDISYKYADFNSGLNEEVYKIMVKTVIGFIPQAYANKYNLKYYLMKDQETYVYINEYVDKMKAIQMIATKEQVSIEQIVSFGDDINDMKMLEDCGVGVAVKNAIPSLFSVATEVCGSNKEDGVAHWIEDNIL